MPATTRRRRIRRNDACGHRLTGALRSCRGGSLAGLVRRARARPPLAADPRPVRDPRQRGHVAADAGGARRTAVAALARALADGRGARRGLGRRRDPRVAGARLQPAGARPPPRGAAGRGARLARRPLRAARRRPVHRGRRGVLRVRSPGAARRRQRASRLRPHGSLVHSGGRPGAYGSREDDLPRADPTLRALPAGRGVSVARSPFRAEPPARALRGLVPPTAGNRPADNRRRLTAARRRGGVLPGTRRARAGSTGTSYRFPTSRVPSARCSLRTSPSC